jgi:hypothetical protein
MSLFGKAVVFILHGTALEVCTKFSIVALPKMVRYNCSKLKALPAAPPQRIARSGKPRVLWLEKGVASIT